MLGGKSIREGLDNLKQFEAQYPHAITGETPFSMNELREYETQLSLFAMNGTHVAEISMWIEAGDQFIRQAQQFLEQSDRQIEQRNALLEQFRQYPMVETWNSSEK